MLQFLRTHKYATAGGAIVIIGVLSWLAFGYFGVQYLFIDDEVDEALPVFDAAPAVVDDTADDTADDNTADDNTAGDDAAEGDMADDPAETLDGSDEMSGDAADGADDDNTATPTPDTAPPVTAAPEIVTEFSGQFEGDAHPAVGTALVLGNGTDQRFLRFDDDFATDNGPDLNVYLVNTSAANVTDDFIDLGDLTGNIGSQNYEIPADVDLEVYDQVHVWCVRFGVGFGHADLSAT